MSAAPDQDLIWRQKLDGGPPMPVTSVFNRMGAVVAEDGDYAASQVSNDSSVPGPRVSDALDGLQTAVITAQGAAASALAAAATAQAGDRVQRVVAPVRHQALTVAWTS